MKKYFFSLVFLSILAVPLFSEAVTATSTISSTPQNSCPLLTTNLKEGSRDVNTNGQVTLLQNFLREKGYLNEPSSGYFGKQTKQAVKAFQVANGIDSNGQVGPITRASINLISCNSTPPLSLSEIINEAKDKAVGESGDSILSCGDTLKINLDREILNINGLDPDNSVCFYSTSYYQISIPVKSDPLKFACADSKGYSGEGIGLFSNITSESVCSSTAPIIHVLSPNGGEKFEVGKKYTIKWETKNSSPEVQIGIRDVRFSSEIGSGEQTLAFKIPNTGSYQVTIPATLGSLSNGTLEGDNYKIIVYPSNGGASDLSDETFTIFSNSTTPPQQKPDITVVSVDCTPVHPKINEWISCEVTVLNDSLIDITNSFDVNVQGLTGRIEAPLKAHQKKSVKIKNAFNFSTAGEFSLNFPVDIWNTVDESNENNNNLSKTIKIANEINPKINGLSPQPVKVGEQLTVSVKDGGSGGSLIITNESGANTWFRPYNIDITMLPGFIKYANNKITITVPDTIGRGLLPENSGYEPIIPITTGTYKLYVSALDSNNNRIMSNVVDVKIINDQFSESSITVLSPNGEESWKQGREEKIKWSTSNVPVSQSISIGARGYGSFIVTGEDGLPHTVTEKDFSLIETPNTGSVTINVNLPLAKYKLFAKTNVNGTIINDFSDDYFTVKNGTLTDSSNSFGISDEKKSTQTANVLDSFYLLLQKFSELLKK